MKRKESSESYKGKNIFFFIDVVAIKRKRKRKIENASYLPQKRKRRTVKTSKCF
jgi:hypothetical protein